MNENQKAREYARRLDCLLDEARKDGFVFAVSGGRRGPYKLTVTVMPYTLDLSDDSGETQTQEG